jgi:hypothetical protein
VKTSWFEGLQRCCDELDEIGAHAQTRLDHDAAVALGTSLASRLNEPVQFCVAAMAEESGEVGLPTDLGTANYRRVTPHISMNRVVLPFSTEREPKTQGNRTALLLASLGALLIVLATVDRSMWTPCVADAGICESQPPTIFATSSLGTITEVLVAILLIFPAALYAQFYQARPQTDIGNRAQLGTFALLSLVFALPILPAALLAAGHSIRTSAFFIFWSGFVALASALTVGLVFRAKRLRSLRWKFAKAAEPVTVGPAQGPGN